MKIQYCSDLHLEFLDNRKWILSNPIIPKGDILILAGDIVLFNEMQYHQKFFDYVSEHFKHTYWIPGNHEYYNSDISLRYGSFEENIRDNVTLLNNKVKIIDGIRLVFSTLWSHISIEKQLLIQQSLSDFRVIRSNQKKLTIADYNQMYMENRLFLESALKKKNNLSTVVVTHHPPTFINYPEKYRDSFINEAFGTELGVFIENNEIDYWIYGHHHCNVPDFTVGKTRLVTNQLGYIKYGENDNYTNDATFTL